MFRTPPRNVRSGDEGVLWFRIRDSFSTGGLLSRHPLLNIDCLIISMIIIIITAAFTYNYDAFFVGEFPLA